ncbi:MAG: hypothetical protein PHF63_08915 [Herbinix sp.]|nr:hypothetical protein [Herbinix sp.]
MGSYIASTKQEQQEMLKTIGCNNFEELFSQIPVKVKKIDNLNLPEGMSELEIRRIYGNYGFGKYSLSIDFSGSWSI